MTPALHDASGGGPAPADVPAVRIRSLTRNFGPVRALRDVSFDVPAGDITALLGENGAGKSTLLKILAGLQPPSEGSVTVFGEEVTSFEPADMLSRHGVAIVPQELSLLPDRTVAENVLSGVEPGNRWFPSRRRMLERTVELLAELDLHLDPNASVRTLDLATQQLIVVARSIARGCRVLILDEPTAMLTPAEADRLFALMDRLKAAGTTMLYVSHRMPEVFRLADHIQVLRDGGHVASWRSEDTTPDQAVAAMVGRELGRFTRRSGTATPTAEPALKVRGLSGRRHRASPSTCAPERSSASPDSPTPAASNCSTTCSAGTPAPPGPWNCSASPTNGATRSPASNADWRSSPANAARRGC